MDELIAHPPEKHNRLVYVAHILETLGSPQNQIPAIHIAISLADTISLGYFKCSLKVKFKTLPSQLLVRIFAIDSTLMFWFVMA
ncbi:hypothetical protein KOY49_00255 [Candidatus Minimicrobia vallesae]|uniref:Uncharacterized protein n=1 Tax=Candidatus Minimicrobia vallesae TaxID=2841264 RepID=A0A8F1MAE1_9BACT|nr:hypothetical protein [Candidatus Minimicrobia vallesae]QWQ31465.1 hypothetical protein KOY49_00255 [Candidatus Minimicrobia vallesae]